MSNLRAAVVGTGFIGPVHVEGLLRAGVQVVGVLGSAPDKSAAAAAKLGLGKAYASLDELLSDSEVDVVHLASPNRFHFDQASRAIAAGKHVLCEKPLAMNSQQSSRLVQLAAAAGVAGWTIVNDVTARNLQKQDKQWTRAKGFDTFCPVGPWVQDEFDITTSRLTTHQNGTLRQETTFDRLIVPVPQLIAFMSRVMTLLPGDLIVTGTPAGVGPVAPGDQIDITIDGIGVLTNTVSAA